MERKDAVEKIKAMLELAGDWSEPAYYLIDSFISEFPEYIDLAKSMYEEKFGGTFGDQF